MAYHHFKILKMEKNKEKDILIDTPKVISENEVNSETEIQFVDFVMDGTVYKTTLNTKFLNKEKFELPNPKMVKAFIPGTIRKVFVAAGDKVKKDDKLLILEAMKMKNILIAPFNGKIKNVLVKQGTLVSKNEVLVEME